MLWLATLIVVASFVGLWLLYRGMRWAGARWAAKLELRARADHCRCGYPIAGLEVARCPECGRVTAFDATPEDLGLTEEQLRRVQQVRRERERGNP